MTITKISHVPLADLTTIRLVCKKCNTAVELSTRKTNSFLQGGMCRFCGEILIDQTNPSDNPLGNLKSALLGLEKWSDVVEIEFAIPDNARP